MLAAENMLGLAVFTLNHAQEKVFGSDELLMVRPGFGLGAGVEERPRRKP